MQFVRHIARLLSTSEYSVQRYIDHPDDIMFDVPYDPLWTDEQFVSHVGMFRCDHLDIEVLHDLPNCRLLDCSYNRLKALPSLPSCEFVECQYNQISFIPALPRCALFNCHHNQLSFIPPLSQCKTFAVHNNDLPFDSTASWQKVWKLRAYLIQRKYYRRWYWRMLDGKARRKKALHEEIQFTPNIRFLPNEYTKAKEDFQGLL